MQIDLKAHFIKALETNPNFSEAHLQLALLFPYIPFLGLIIAFALVELFSGDNDGDDDNDFDGGILQPVTVPT